MEQEQRNEIRNISKLRFGEDGGISSMSTMKLTTVLRNQVGDYTLSYGFEGWEFVDRLQE